MQKVRLNFELDEWLATSLKRFSVEHPDLETTKDRVQGYIRSLEKQVSGLEAQVHYLNDVAGKSAEAPLNSSFNQDAPTPTTEKESRPTSEPQIIARARADTVQIVTIKGKAYRVRDSQADSVIWQDGDWTFSRKKAEALALASELDQIKTSGAEKREQTQTAEEGKREQTQTLEHEKRASITVDMHRQIADYKKPRRELALQITRDEPVLKQPCPLTRNANYCINNLCDRHGQCLREGLINNNRAPSEHGAPVADMVV